MPPRYRTSLLAACLLLLACVVPTVALGHKSSGNGTGGVSPSSTSGTYVAGGKAKVRNGIAIPPRAAPPQVVKAIRAANRIVRKHYRWGGGHGSFNDSAYDCSGSVSYALHGGGLLRSPLDSSSFMHWGRAGRGHWITVYANSGHAFMVIAGLRFDTGWRDSRPFKGTAPGSGPRWARPRPTGGFSARHPNGL